MKITHTYNAARSACSVFRLQCKLSREHRIECKNREAKNPGNKNQEI